MVRVVHLALFHSPEDPRIVGRECRTLADAGYEVHVVTGQAAAEPSEGITFHSLDLPASPSGLLQRIKGNVLGVFRAFAAARRLRASLYHLHEVPLIPVGLWLRACGNRVVYDVHEDAFREKISNGLTLGHPIAGWVFAFVSAVLESLARLAFDGFVAATPHIGTNFPDGRTIVAQNFPHGTTVEHGGSPPRVIPYDQRANLAVYIGNLFANRGAREMIDAMAELPEELNARMLLAGRLVPTSLESELKQRPGWSSVEFLGWQQQSEVGETLARGRVGLVLFHPRPEHLDAYPNKLFEYMAAGLPVVASDFPLWRNIVADGDCGLVVDPLQPRQIAAAIQELLEDPAKAAEMGRRGAECVRDKYNWQNEASKLLNLYTDVLD